MGKAIDYLGCNVNDGRTEELGSREKARGNSLLISAVLIPHVLRECRTSMRVGGRGAAACNDEE
jgi:hypothetical protein